MCRANISRRFHSASGAGTPCGTGRFPGLRGMSRFCPCVPLSADVTCRIRLCWLVPAPGPDVHDARWPGVGEDLLRQDHHRRTGRLAEGDPERLRPGQRRFSISPSLCFSLLQHAAFHFRADRFTLGGFH